MNREAVADKDAFVITEETGLLCIIPSSLFRSAWLDSIAAGRVIDAGEVCLADVDKLAGDIEEIKDYLRDHIEDVLRAAGLFDYDSWDNIAVWERLCATGVVDGDDCYPPDDWQPIHEQLHTVTATVGESFYESSSFRNPSWSSELPDSIVERFGKHSGGFFGDYFGFEPGDRDEICAALDALGYTVLDSSDVIPWTHLW